MTKEKFERYEGVRVSGVTNMFAIKTVMDISGLTKEECWDIMKNYDKYSDMYLIPKTSQSQ